MTMIKLPLGKNVGHFFDSVCPKSVTRRVAMDVRACLSDTITQERDARKSETHKKGVRNAS